MTYEDQLDKENISSQYLCVLNPRRQVTGTWANPSGSLYTVSFDYGYVNELRLDNSLVSAASSSALTDGDWYYDFDASLLYFNDGSTDPNASGFFTASYELYLGTFDAAFHRDPLDSSSPMVYYEPLILKAPPIFQNITDILFGFLPSQTSPLVLATVTKFFQRHVYDSSFNQAPIRLYHYLGKLETENIKLVVNGKCGNIKYSDEQMTLTVYDTNQIFDNFFRNPLGESYYSFADFPNLDPNFLAKPIRRVFGYVKGFVPVNVDYEFNNPTTSNNRKWVCMNPSLNSSSRVTLVVASPASTATRTYLSSADAMQVGDSVWIDSSAGSSFDEYPIITAINTSGTPYIEHAAITNPAAAGSIVSRAFVSRVDIVKDGVLYTARYIRDYTTFIDGSTQSRGFLFNSSLEANLGIPSPITPSDLVFCTLYGNLVSSTLGGLPFGTNSTEIGALTNPVAIVYEILKDYIGLSEDQINGSSFTSALAEVTSQVGFAVPRFSVDEFPKYRDILGDLFASELLKLTYDKDNKFKIEVTQPLGSQVAEIGDDEIIEASISYDYSYSDVISDAIVEYAGSEVNNRNEVTADLSVQTVRSTSDVALNVHQVKKQKTFKSLHIFQADAESLADRLAFAFGDRRGIISFKTKNRFFNTEIDDRIDITRDSQPGFSYVAGTERTRSGSVIGTNKTLDEISIELDDQKGIEDNSGSW